MGKFNLSALLNENRNVAENRLQKNTYRIEQISIRNLHPSKDNFYSTDDIESLKQSIEMFGLKQNLTVRPCESGGYEIIAGHRRYTACLALLNEGKTEYEYVPCGVEMSLNDIDRELILIMTNSTTREKTDYEKIQEMKRLKELLTDRRKMDGTITGRTRDIVADSLKTSVAQIGKMEAIDNNLAENFKEELKDSKIKMSIAYELSTLPEDKQKIAYEQYRQNGTISINDVRTLKEPHSEKTIKVAERIPLENGVFCECGKSAVVRYIDLKYCHSCFFREINKTKDIEWKMNAILNELNR